MNVTVVMGYGAFLLAGLACTLAVSIAALLLGLIFGVLGCAARLSPRRIVRQAVSGYVTLFQSLPELLVVLVVYFSGDAILRSLARLLVDDAQVEISPFLAGALALALAMGAYVTDVLRSAYLQVPLGLREASNALGLKRWQSLLLIDAPQILRLAMPALGNLFLVVQKNSALVSVIGLAELMRQAQVAAGATHDPLSFYLMAGLAYLVLAAITMALQYGLESRLSRGMV
ncbi:MAG TPA: ABC transporter permease subunit [Nordella sp.]|nr:ABC transporter permease subunit [Nordella sp.]